MVPLAKGPFISDCAVESAMRHCNFEDRSPRGEQLLRGYLMTSSNAHGQLEAGLSDLNGLRVLVVEDFMACRCSHEEAASGLGSGCSRTSRNHGRRCASDLRAGPRRGHGGHQPPAGRASPWPDRSVAWSRHPGSSDVWLRRGSAGTGKGRGHPAEARQQGASSRELARNYYRQGSSETRLTV